MASSKNTNAYFVPDICVCSKESPRKESGISPPAAYEKGRRARFAFYLVCAVLHPRMLEALKSGAVYFLSDPEPYLSPGAPCSFQTTTLKCALASISVNISYLLAGNREGIPSWHCTLEHLRRYTIRVFSRNM